jgi:hypothetical protein
MAVFKTHQFLPDIFQTDTNKKFLNATFDQLVSEPQLKKVNGFIGRKLAPSYKASDSYILEPTSNRENYQLEPSIVIKDKFAKNIDFATTYVDTINKIKYYGGLIDNHNRLFDNEFYSYDPKIDLDKFVNFSQYYWLKEGPDPIQITSSGVSTSQTFTVTYNPINNAYEFSGSENVPNPSITLARGGVYEFTVNSIGNNFYIQGKPGKNGIDPDLSNIQTRDVFGVSDNGTDSGTVKFTVPKATAQDKFINLPTVETVSYATDLAFNQVQGAKPQDVIDSYGGIDGPIAYLDGATIVFVNREYIDDTFWVDTVRTENGIVYFDQSNQIALADRTNVYTISIQVDSDGNDRIVLLSKIAVPEDHKVKIKGGASYTSKEAFVRDSAYELVPYISAPFDVLYYQSDTDSDAVGIINIIEPISNDVDPAVDIVGELYYTSPNGIVLTNGMKIYFDSSVPASWQNKYYYVEGVGTGIRLVPESELISIETINDSFVISGGLGYVVDDRLTIQGGTYERQAVAVVDAITPNTATFSVAINTITGVVTGVTIVNGGAGYLTAPTLTFTSPASGSSATASATITAGVVTSVTLTSGGNGYEAPPILTATDPESGAIKSFKIKDLGDYTVLPTNPVDVTGGSGASARLEVYLQPEYPDYITINRSSLDRNPWSRGNRWVHRDVIEKTAVYNNSTLTFNQSNRASRPIIEFEADYHLHNFGAVAKLPIDILDDTVERAFQEVQGKICIDTTTFAVHNELTLTHGDRVVFARDLDNTVRNKIYNFTIEKAVDEPADVYKAYLVEADDATVEENNTVLALSGRLGGQQYHYNGTTWVTSQAKTARNQEPLYDIVDDQGISFANGTTYTGTTFTGTKIFSYKRGSGNNDIELGFPLSYKNFANQGDIEFENNFDAQVFSYLAGSTTLITEHKINSGYLQKNITTTTCTRENIWKIARTFSKQFKIYDFVYDGVTNLFPIDSLPDVSTNFPHIKVYVNNKILTSGNFATTQVVDRFAILVNPDLIVKDDVVFVAVFNEDIPLGDNAHYEIPINLDINTLNKNHSTLTLGQMRNHLISLKNNGLNVVGSVPGNSNLRDIVYKNTCGSILQHSAPAVYSGLFLNHPTMNFVNAIKLANREYTKFKHRFLEIAGKTDLDFTNVQDSFETILTSMHSVKNDSFPWYHSDMIPHGTTTRTLLPTFTVIDPDLVTFELTTVFNDKVPSNKAVLVYVTRTIDNVTSKTLAVKGRDYTFNTDRAALTFTSNFRLLFNDKIDIVEYSDTDGSFVPETPTKMGMYPKFVPEKYLDNTLRTPVYMIQGHDGSLTPAFNDFRDDLILELERRIYNNIKIDYNINTFDLIDYMPGKFRDNDYTRAEFNQVLSQGFLAWVGTNRLDFSTTKYFRSSDPFTWNFKLMTDVVNGESLPGTWRACHRYFYDTDRPHTHPWEMLGFSEKPDYWQDRYGPAPYTGGNSVLWSDLSVGYIHGGDRAGFDLRYQRPNLSDFIPVDDNGNLRSPEQILTADFDGDKANVSYAVGDIGPVELAWRRSSEYPFAVMLALALTKPARFFALQANVHRYNRNLFTGQFEINETGQHLTPRAIQVNGYVNSDGTVQRTAGYVNWIKDYIKNLGVSDASGVIIDNLSRLNVQLTYKVGGFTDKKFVELLAEQSSPSSINNSVVIPDENYRIQMYKGSPIRKITYSAVIVQKSARGYTVSGYDLTNPYFFIIPSIPNNNAYAITENDQRVVIYRDFRKVKYTVPYGFEFNTVQQVADFLVSYQRYLNSQGFVFTDRDNDLGTQKDWVLSVREFLHWSIQGWRNNNIIALSPVNNVLKVYEPTAVVDEIKNTPFNSRVLDVNFEPIIKNDFTVYRESNLFTLQSNSGQTVGFAELDLVQYEHLLALDNVTVFNDVIYVPELGNRQYRLKFVGHKTDAWNGSLELPGFMFSSDSVDSWSAGSDYLKGTIVQHKNRYYTALENITAATDFQTLKWKQIEKSELRSGMVRNYASNAKLGEYLYNIDNQPDNEDLQLFSNGLIGFRERDYFTNLGIDVTTQSKYYQGLITQKGTPNSINALEAGVFGNLASDIDWYEDWAVRVGEYGALETTTFVETVLDETKINSNPTTAQFTDSNSPAQNGVVELTVDDVYKISDEYTSNVFRTENRAESSKLRPLPVAGFVNLSDIDTTLFSLSNYQSLSSLTDSIGTGYKIWVAKDFNDTWNVYRASYIDGSVFVMRHRNEGTVEVVFSANHGLAVNDVVVIKSFDDRFDGVYKVDSIVDSTRFNITVTQNIEDLKKEAVVVATGILYNLTSAKIDKPADIQSVMPVTGWKENDKVWVENLDSEGNWGVYNKTSPWVYNSKAELDGSKLSGNDNFGTTVSIEPNLAQLMYVGSPGSGSGRVNSFVRSSTNAWTPSFALGASSTGLDSFGDKVVNAEGYVAVSAPDSSSGKGYVYVFKDGILQQIITDSSASPNDNFGSSLAISRDALYLYVGASGADKVFCYQLKTRTALDPYSLPVERYELTLDANVTFAVGDTVTYQSPGTTTTASGTVVFDSTRPANTSVVIVTGNIAAFSETELIAVNGANVAANIVSTVQSAAISTFSNVSILSSDPTEVLVYSQLRAAEYVPTVEYTVSGEDITFTSPPAVTEVIQVIKRSNYYTKISEISGNASTNFGSSLGTNRDGSVVAIGSDKAIVNSYSNEGLVYVYHRTITELVTDGVSSTFTAPDAFGTDYRVLLDGEVIVEGGDFFTIAPSSVQFPSAPTAGLTLRVETNNFVQDQIITPSQTGVNGQRFGTDVAVCGTGCNIYSTAPLYFKDMYSSGAVYRLVNVGRLYGNVTGTVSNPTVTVGQSIIINNRPVEFTGTSLTTVINNINGKNIPGVTASNVDNKLHISSDVQVATEKLNIKPGSTGTALTDLGIQLYKHVQAISHPNQIGEKFGTSIGISQGSGKLAVASDGADITVPTTFDKDTNETIFDSLSTSFVKIIKDSGAVYMYDLMPNPFESEENPAVFTFSQKLIAADVQTGYNFGADIDLVNDIMVIGVTNDSSVVLGGGSAYSYYNANSKPGWDLIRYKEPRVAIDSVNSAFIYNKKTSTILNYLDILDPVKGKLLGVVEQELDYIEEFDPASYNTGTISDIIVNNSFYWTSKQVGKTWWDTGVIRFIDYEQDSLVYRGKNWGGLFPGSSVRIYEWVESDFLPSQYVANGGDGIPKYADDTAFTQTTTVDPATGVIINKFYFWVSNKEGVDANLAKRNLSISLLERYISNPKDQGIPYIGLTSPSSINLYNINDKTVGQDIILHLDTSKINSSSLIHNEFELIQQGNANSLVPKRILDKLRDSLRGADANGRVVPDTLLKPQDRIGILNRPRQGIFVDRLKALEVYVKEANKILIKYPVLLISNPTSLYLKEDFPAVYDAEVASFTDVEYLDTTDFADGYKILIPEDSRYNNRWSLLEFNGVTRQFELIRAQSFKTDLLWTPKDWYDSSYIVGNDIHHTVNTYGDIQTQTLSTNDYIKILDDGAGHWAIYRYESTGQLLLIASQSATIELSRSLFDATTGVGFDTSVFDATPWDNQAGTETANIFNSIANQIFINSLAIEFNNLFFALVNYIFEEQKNPDWIFKTSFIDVLHNLRSLEQIPNYSRDNQNFYEDYINEIKPYRTQLREFIPTYNKLDEATGNWTDFDIPSRWFADENRFRAPNIQLSSDSTHFTTDLYSPYSDNYKFKIGEIIVGNAGVRYTTIPAVEITGGGGSGAEARAVINPGQGTVTSITVTKPGSGYTSNPTITINGVGEGATAYALLNNEYDSAGSYNTVRSINSTIKFDRITYTSNVTQWQANTAYPNTIIADGNKANAYDLNRVEYNSYVGVGSQDIDVTDVVFKPDGTKMYVSGNNTDTIYEYTLSTPWEVSTASNVAIANVYTQDSSVQGLFFRDDGERMYTVGINTDSVYEYRLATPWSVNTAANISVKSIVSEEASARAVEFDKLGTRMYILGTLGDTVYEYELSQPWKISSASYSSRSLYVGGEDNIPTGMRFKHDGTELFIVGQQTNKVWKYALSTPWDVSTGSVVGDHLLDTTQPTGIAFKGDGTQLFVADPSSDWVQQYNFSSDGIVPIEGNVYITSGNIIFYNNTAYLATNANVSSQTVFDFTRYTEINSGNALLSAADRITSYYVPSEGRPAKDLDQLMFGVNYPGNKVQGKTFTANSFSLTSNVIGFSYTGHKITSANIQQVDFIDSGFNLNDPIQIQGQYNFNFENNATFRVVSLTRDEMMLSGQPIESVVTLFLGANITANEGDYITQSNSTANARVLHNYTSSANISVIQEKYGWTEMDSNVVSVNGVVTTANVRDVLSTGTANVKINNLYIDDLLDSNIVSFYTDTAIGTRPEDINIVGGFYLDAYNSHAPEELVPGRMFDALEMRVFTNTASNTASYGFRVFEPMSGDRRYYRINANSSTTLSANLSIGDVNLFVDDASVLPDPGAAVGIPGEVFINGELIHYYQKYDAAKILTASVWTANTEFATDSLITFDSNVFLVLGNVYANSTSYIDTTNIKQVYVNSLSQLRRGVDGTGSANVHTANTRVVDSSLAQILPNIVPTTTTTLTGEKTVTANVTWRIGLSKTISANIGDYMTMTSPAANVRILDTVANANVVAVHFVSGNLTIGSTANVLINGTATQANVATMQILGAVESDGNVSVTGKIIKQDYLWKPYGTGDTLESSTTEWATWIKDERSYTP